DQINLNNSNTPTGLTNVTVTGGDPSANDSLIVNGVGSTVTVDTAASTITGALGAGGAIPTSYKTIGNLSVSAGSSTTLAVTGPTSYITTPGTAANAGAIQTDTLPIRFTSFGSATTLALTGSVTDSSLTANGTSGNDTFTVAANGDVTL